MVMRSAALAALILLASGCVSSLRWSVSETRAAPPPRERATATEVPPDDATAALLAAVNAARARGGVCGRLAMPSAPPLVWGSLLALAAERHGLAMASQGFFDHRAPDGSGVGERIAATGFRASAWGETLAAGYVDPVATVEAFLGSPTHCEVLLAAPFEVLGAALVEQPDSVYGSYWTVVVATPR